MPFLLYHFLILHKIVFFEWFLNIYILIKSYFIEIKLLKDIFEYYVNAVMVIRIIFIIY